MMRSEHFGCYESNLSRDVESFVCATDSKSHREDLLLFPIFEADIKRVVQ